MTIRTILLLVFISYHLMSAYCEYLLWIFPYNSLQIVSVSYLAFCSFHVVDKHALQFTHGVRGTPDCAWPLDTKAKERSAQSPGHLWRLDGASLNMSSSISCIKKFGKPGQHKILYPLNFCEDVYLYFIGKNNFLSCLINNGIIF